MVKLKNPIVKRVMTEREMRWRTLEEIEILFREELDVHIPPKALKKLEQILYYLQQDAKGGLKQHG